MSIRSLSVSFVAHVAAILLVVAVQFPRESTSRLERLHHVTLIFPDGISPNGIAPAPKPRRVRIPKIPLRAASRPYQPPLIRPWASKKEIMLELPAVPLREPILAFGPPPQLPRVNTPAPFTAAPFAAVLIESSPVVPMKGPKLELRAAGFSGSETTPREPLRPSGVAAGGFDTAVQATPGRILRGGIGASGFSGGGIPVMAAPARSGNLARGDFGDTTVSAPAAVRRFTEEPGFAPVQITSKPRPAYSVEGRSLQIEGEVLLDMVFSASGEVRFVRVVEGLGHGLDENAIAAARGIRFRPAVREGNPVDSPAIVHIVFQLAY